MNRIADNTQNFTTTGSGSWTCPAGVTKIVLTVSRFNNFTTGTFFTYTLDVVPNTTYSITINSTGNLANATFNSFGSFIWSGGSRLQIRWVE